MDLKDRLARTIDFNECAYYRQKEPSEVLVPIVTQQGKATT